MTLQAQSSNTAARAEVTKYYAFNGSRAVMRQANNEVFYLFGDHLGSSSLAVDWQGRKISEMRYAPWGETRWAWELDGEGYTNRLYTSQLRQDRNYVGKIDDYNARFYNRTTARFLSADTIVPDPTNSQYRNRYTYSYNNPIVYNDHSGHFGVVGAVFGALGGALIGGAAQAIGDLLFTGEVNLNAAKAAAIGGAIQGGICGATAGVGCLVGGAAAGAAAQSIANDILTGGIETVDIGKAAEAATVGTIASVATFGLANSFPGMSNAVGRTQFVVQAAKRIGVQGFVSGLTQFGMNVYNGVPMGEWLNGVGEATGRGIIGGTVERASYPLGHWGKKPYSNLTERGNPAAGHDFSSNQTADVIRANTIRNFGLTLSDFDGTLIYGSRVRSKTGAQVDHIVPKSNGGPNSYSNARLLTRYQNRQKSNTGGW